MTRPAGDLLVVGIPGEVLAPREAALLTRLRPFGVILLPRNVAGPEQLAELTAAVRGAAPESLLFLDAEGGRVDRLRRIVGPAPAGEALACRPPALARRAGLWIGHSLRLFGFHVDFAPVVDLDRGLANNALDGRYLGTGPRRVVPRARAFLQGLRAAGVGGCLKHFPGLGGAGEDTHDRGSVVDLCRRELDVDLRPFQALGPLAGAVMAGHAAYPALAPADLPATLAPAVATGLLRRELGFSGVLFSDDLEMGALATWGELPQRAEASLAAGCDALLLCQTLGAAPAVAEHLAAPALATRAAEARARLAGYRALLAAWPPPRRFSAATVRRRLAELRRATG